MPILEPHHDLGHAVEDDGAWSESYYFNGFDQASDSGLFTRVGVRPNEGTMDVGMSLWLPSGDLGEYHSWRPQTEMVDSVLEVGAVRYEMLEPMRSWRLSMDGDVPVRRCERGSTADHEVHLQLDLVFSALTPAIGTDGQSSGGPRSAQAAAASGTTGKGHFEQAGSWSGWLEVDGVRHQWADALGNRDRSWGPRRWGGPTMWRWFSGNIDDRLHFGGIRLGTSEGDLHRGWVYDDGRANSVAEWRIRSELASDGVTHKVVHLEIEDKKGRTYELLGEVQRVADIGRGGTLINEGLTRWTLQGEGSGVRSGFGIAEYLHQLTDDGLPVVAVA